MRSFSKSNPSQIFACRYQWTEFRETVNPRPTQEMTIAATQKVYADAGVGSYNEGAHDDVCVLDCRYVDLKSHAYTTIEAPV